MAGLKIREDLGVSNTTLTETEKFLIGKVHKAKEDHANGNLHWEHNNEGIETNQFCEGFMELMTEEDQERYNNEFNEICKMKEK